MSCDHINIVKSFNCTHNCKTKWISASKPRTAAGCLCKIRSERSASGWCNTEITIYQANICSNRSCSNISNNNANTGGTYAKFYVGSCESSFKIRLNNETPFRVLEGQYYDIHRIRLEEDKKEDKKFFNKNCKLLKTCGPYCNGS